MHTGDINLSRARGTKAQRRQTYFQNPPDENTIDFQQAKRQRHIELRPKTLGQESLILSLLDHAVDVTVALGPL